MANKYKRGKTTNFLVPIEGETEALNEELSAEKNQKFSTEQFNFWFNVSRQMERVNYYSTFVNIENMQTEAYINAVRTLYDMLSVDIEEKPDLKAEKEKLDEAYKHEMEKATKDKRFEAQKSDRIRVQYYRNIYRLINRVIYNNRGNFEV